MFSTIHIGKEIEKKIGEKKMTKTEFAKKIGTSKQNLNRILEKESIDTALLQKFGAALDFNFFTLYTNPPIVNIKAENHSGASESGDVLVLHNECSSELKLKLSQFELEIKMLNNLIKEKEQNIAEKERNIKEKERLIEEKERFISFLTSSK